MISGTSQNYTTGYGSPENVLKQLYEEYNKKVKTIVLLIFCFFLILNLSILNTESWNWVLIGQKFLILCAFLFCIQLIYRFFPKKEEVPELISENYSLIIQVMKRYYSFHWMRLLIPIFSIFYCFVLYLIDDNLRDQPISWSLFADNYLVLLLIFFVSYIYDIYHNNKRFNQLKKLEEEFNQ